MELQTEYFRIQFTRRNDRFHGEIDCRKGEAWQSLLKSIEGDFSIDWPPSPPWQQIVGEPVGPGGRTVLLGVGQSGSGHWSISIDEQDHGSLLLDVACKTSKPPAFLGSTWQLSSGWTIGEAATSHNLRLLNQSFQHSIHVHAAHGELTPKRQMHDAQIVIHPLSPASHTKPFRWAMKLSLDSVR